MSVDAKGTPAFEGWAVVELMGHRRLGGYVTEIQLAGHGLLRVEMPEDDAGAALTQFYSPSALYCLTPATEQTARAALRLSRPEPISEWDLERALKLLKQPALPEKTDAMLRCTRCGRGEPEVIDWEVDDDDQPTGRCLQCAEEMDSQDGQAEAAVSAFEAGRPEQDA